MKQCKRSKPITNCWDAPIGVATASHIPSTHKGHGFRDVQAECYLSAGAATCVEFKVRTSELQLPHGINVT